MANLTTFDEALKIDYLPVMREQLNNATMLLSRLERDTENFEGKRWQLTVHHGRNSGVGATSETGIPTAGSQSYKNPYGFTKFNRGRIKVSTAVIKASKSDKGSIVRALDSEIKGVTDDLKKDYNTQLHNDGSAVRALVNGDPGTAATLTVDNPGTRYLFDGMKVDILNPSGGAARANSSGITISTVTSDTTATMSANFDAAVADNDYVTRAGATDGAGTSYEIMGIKGIVDDGTYVTTLHNLSRTTYPWWKCSTFAEDDNGGTLRDLSNELIQKAISAVEKNGGQVNLIMSDVDMRDAYVALLVADKRFVNTMKLDGGWTGVEYSSEKAIPWVADVDCQPHTVYFLDTTHLKIMLLSDWDWMQEDGAILARTGTSAEYEAVIENFSELATDKPRAHSFLRDVQ